MNPYRSVLHQRGVLRITLSQLLARLPLGILPLATLLHVREVSGSLATAGAVVACMTFSEAIAMPLSGRLLGRCDARTILMVLAVAHAASLVALAAAGDVAWLLALLAATGGATVPPIMSAVRSLYPKLVPREGVQALFALDTTAQELIWIVGPVAATFLAATGVAGAGLLAAAAVTITGTVWFASAEELTRLGSSQDGRSRFGHVLAQRSVFVAMSASAALMASFTALEVAVVTTYEHDPLIAGAVIAVPSVASLIGGLTWGHRRFDLRALTLALVVVAGGTAGVATAQSPVVMLIALFVSGLGFAPALAALYYMVSNAVSGQSSAEAFGWLQTAALGGAAVGTASSGLVSEAAGSVGGYLLATALACLAVAIPLITRIWGGLPGLPEPGVVRT